MMDPGWYVFYGAFFMAAGVAIGAGIVAGAWHSSSERLKERDRGPLTKEEAEAQQIAAKTKLIEAATRKVRDA